MTTRQSSVQIVILGAGYAGMVAALRLAHQAKRLPGAAAAITLVNGDTDFVERIRLHQTAAGERVRRRPIAALLRGAQVRFVHGLALALAPQAQQVTVQTAQGSEHLSYDYLLYALGSTTDKDSVAGVREHALAVGNPADSLLLRGRLLALAQQETAGGEVVVVGGGLTGIETAAEIAEQHPSLRVHLVTAGGIGQGLSAGGRAYLRQTFTRLGVRVQEEMRVEYVDAQAVVAADGRTIPCDLCVWAGPMRALPLAQEAGLAVNERGQILVDATLRSITAPSIYAAGDAAAFVPEAGVKTRMACATAIPMGAHAAGNLYAQLLGQAQQPFRFGYVAQCISLGRSDGLLQLVRADDSPHGQIVTGRPAVWVKEGICRAVALVATTGWAARSYRWRQSRAEPVNANDRQPVLAGTRRLGKMREMGEQR